MYKYFVNSCNIGYTELNDGNTIDNYVSEI
jgi:hypothetical protein